MIGPFADPRDGAMAVFTTQEDAEDFGPRQMRPYAGLVLGTFDTT